VSVRPPSGARPPALAEIDGRRVDLVALARDVCRRYYQEYPDEHERYGPSGVDWCLHDNQWLLSWAVDDVRGVADLEEQARWLARVLHGRHFPVDRLARNLQLAADVMQDAVDERGAEIAARLREAAATVHALVLG